MTTFIIAEAGINHNGDIEFAHKLIDAAYECGADACKFQTFDCEYLEPPGERREMLRALQLSFDDFARLKEYCGSRIEFMSTPFHRPALWSLVNFGLVRRLKISSGHLRDKEILEEARLSGLPIILSTGMGTMDDIYSAVETLGFARPWDKEQPMTPPGLAKNGLTILHCTSAYPTPIEDVNLLAMDRIQAKFGCKVGLSDHTLSTVIPAAAVALGASVIEKHITLDRTMKGPDHAASLEPFDFKRMVVGIREVEKALGDGIKRPMPSEEKTMEIVKERMEWAA